MVPDKFLVFALGMGLVFCVFAAKMSAPTFQKPNNRFLPLCTTKALVEIQEDTSFFLSAARDNARWSKNRPIKICFLDGRPEVINRVKVIAAEWMDYANIEFSYVKNPAASDVRITLLDGGYRSMVGTDALSEEKPYPTMWLGRIDTILDPAEFRGIVLHEFGHMLGLVHEQLREDTPIQWNEEAVYKCYVDTLKWLPSEVYDNFFAKKGMDILHSSPYDSLSIMHYPVPAHFTLNGYQVGWNNVLTDIDKAHIRLVYP